MIQSLQLNKVEFLPKELSPGVLYVSEAYAVAGHLCACGCGTKVITPLGRTEWSFSEKNGKATLQPSIGNWQLPCRSHYWIIDNNIEWSYQWTDKQIRKGRQTEEKIRKQYYKKKQKNKGPFSRLLLWLFN